MVIFLLSTQNPSFPTFPVPSPSQLVLVTHDPAFGPYLSAYNG